MIDAPPNGTAAASHERALQKGCLPASVKAPTVHVNRFPLGDIENFSVSRAAYAMAQSKALYGGSRHQRTWLSHAPWELAYYDALDQQEGYRREAKGLESFQLKAQGEMVSGLDGGFLAPEEWARPYFGLLRSFSFLEQLPITRVSVPARVTHLPKLMGDISTVYPAESASIAASGFLFGQLSYTARNAKALVPLSNEMMRDAPELTDQVLRVEGAKAHALDRDTQALTGQGGPSPTGLVTMAGAGTISKYYPGADYKTTIGAGANHGTPSFLHLSALRGKVHQLNGATVVPAGQAHCNGMVAHTRLEQTIQTQAGASSPGPWTDNNGRPLWMSGLSTPAIATDEDHAQNGALLGQVWALTNILPTNSTDGGGTASSFIIAGWWEQYVLFECLAFGFDATSEATGFQSDQTLVRMIHRYDCGPAHPEAFAVLAGVDV